MKKETGAEKRRRVIGESGLSEFTVIGHEDDKDSVQKYATRKSKARGLSYTPAKRGCIKGSTKNGS